MTSIHVPGALLAIREHLQAKFSFQRAGICTWRPAAETNSQIFCAMAKMHVSVDHGSMRDDAWNRLQTAHNHQILLLLRAPHHRHPLSPPSSASKTQWMLHQSHFFFDHLHSVTSA